MNTRSYYTDEVTKDLMNICKKRIEDIEKVLKEESIPANKTILCDEMIAVVDLMSYIDTRHKDYLRESISDRKKATLKAMLQAFKLQKRES